MIDLKNEEIRAAVREHYGLIAREQKSGCGCGPACCTPDPSGEASQEDCGCSTSCCGDAKTKSHALGYGIEELETVPEGANLGLGCGNPQAIASLKPGETVLDLGSGGGFDSFLASKAVGPSGQVLGVDMTYDMLNLARTNAEKGGYKNVEFRLGEIEHVPVADNSVDVIISNCVINLSPDKPQVFRDAFRVLKSGGRLAISDVVASGPVPEDHKKDLALLSSCVSGASPIDELTAILNSVGFQKVEIKPKDESREFIKDWVPGIRLTDYIISATIEAVKP